MHQLLNHDGHNYVVWKVSDLTQILGYCKNLKYLLLPKGFECVDILTKITQHHTNLSALQLLTMEKHGSGWRWALKKGYKLPAIDQIFENQFGDKLAMRRRVPQSTRHLEANKQELSHFQSVASPSTRHSSRGAVSPNERRSPPSMPLPSIPNHKPSSVTPKQPQAFRPRMDSIQPGFVSDSYFNETNSAYRERNEGQE
jgi:hypothetical protein